MVGKESKPNVVAGVVTYNRKELLLECLKALEEQTYPVDEIIIIDNASTDGTQSLLKEKGILNDPQYRYVCLETNTGGSGGFYSIMSMVRENTVTCDWLWIMDDDTIPKNDSLENLINKLPVITERDASPNTQQHKKRPISFLASAVFGAEREFMNVPNINMNPTSNGYLYWYEYLRDGIINIESATFVSLLINSKAIYECGLPCKDYFIWGDDIEYTSRLTHYYGDAYFVGSSEVIHKRKGAKNLRIDEEENTGRIRMYYYKFRNEGINARFYSQKKFVTLRNLYAIVRSLRLLNKKNGLLMIKTIWKGNIASITQYKKYKRYILSQLNG